MKFPPGSTDVDAAKDRLHDEIGMHEKLIKEMVADIATAGLFDKRWCAIAQTHFDEGFMAMHRALRDFPTDDGKEYGKIPSTNPLPKEFQPPPAGDFDAHGDLPRVEWKDYKPGGKTGPRDQ